MLSDINEWIAEEFAGGSLTALIIVLSIGQESVEPVASTYLHVIGDEVEWRAMRKMLSGAPAKWNAVAFFTARGENGAVADQLAKVRLLDHEERVRADRLELNNGAFFDNKGRRMLVEELNAGRGLPDGRVTGRYRARLNAFEPQAGVQLPDRRPERL